MRTDSWVIIADDLTGAADAAVGFAPAGGAIVVADSDSEWPDASVLAVNTETRHASADVARQRVAGVAERVGAARVYKKVDSLGRGQIGAEIAGLLTATRSLAIVAPAFPALGRRVVDGHIDASGVDLSSVLASAGVRSVVLGAGQLAQGLDELRGRVDAVIVDASTDGDLSLAALAAERTSLWTVPVGSGGLAAELGRRESHPAAGAPTSGLRGCDHGILFVVGSYADASRGQLESLRHRGVHHVELDHARLGLGHHAELRDVLRSGHAVVSPSRFAEVEDHRADEVAAALAAVVESALPEVTTLVISGGHTARVILERLGVASFRVLGELQRGLIVSEPLGGPPRLITKSGSFGGDDALASLLSD